MVDHLAGFPKFIDHARLRLELGRVTYGERSFSSEPAELLKELQTEALDMACWGYILHTRLQLALSALSATPAPQHPAAGGADDWCELTRIDELEHELAAANAEAEAAESTLAAVRDWYERQEFGDSELSAILSDTPAGQSGGGQ